MTVKLDPRLAADLQSLVKLGRALIDNGEADKAIALVEQALSERPDDPLLRQAAAVLFTREVPSYHRGMLADEPRNAGYAAAIARAAPGKKVLDIGAGSGLLAMLAARAGAREVIACEANATLAATARLIIAANGFADRIRVVARHSTKIDPEIDLDGPADLIVTEIFGHDLLGEDVLPSLSDALKRLVEPGCRVVPARAVVRAALVAVDQPSRAPPDEVCGFDLSLFGRHDRGYQKFKIGDPAIALKSEPFDLFRFELADVATMAGGEARVAARSMGGRIDGVMQWLRLEFDAQSQYENRPTPGTQSHWRALFWPSASAAETNAGDEIAVYGWHEQARLRIWTGEAPSPEAD